MRRVVLAPMGFPAQFHCGERLLRLIVVVELPRQIGDREQNDNQCRDNPERAAVFDQTSGHVERSLVSSRSFMRRLKTSREVLSAMPRTPSTPLGITIIRI